MSERTIYPRHWAKWLVSDDPDSLRPHISQTNPLHILNPIDIWLCVPFLYQQLPAELTAITTHIFRFLALTHFRIHGYVIQFLCMFFWCISSMDERLRIGGLCLFCGWLANNAWWTPHNCEEVKWVHVWLGKDLKDPMFIQVLDSFIVCYITRIYHPGENPEPAYIVWECLWNTVG